MEHALPQELVGEFVLAAYHDLTAVRALLEREPALLEANFERFDETALQAASHVGREDIIRFLLGRGAPMNAFTAAALGLREEVARFLDADPGLANARGVHGISLMFHAALGGNPEVAEAIVARGGLVPGEVLHGAVARNRLEMASWLLERVSHPNAPNHANKTPLAVALELGHTELAALLRARGAREAVVAGDAPAS